ncbi:MAG: DUF5615 family PIN-like protein [Chloroflexota bacterium]
MKVLLDECLDRRLARDITGYDVKTVPQMGWAGIKNGDLLTLAEKQFEVFVTVDRNLSFQQNLTKYNIAVIVLRCRSNRLQDLHLLLPELQNLLPTAKIGDVLWIGKTGS